VSGPDLLHDAVAELYSADPDAFIARRGELAAQARAAGDKTAARKIAALRRPTRSAWLVNQLSRAAPDAAGQLSGLGEELRAAQDRLDGGAIRDLSRQRRDLLGELTRQAFDLAGQRQPPAALREEVTSTLGAAMSDPGVAADLRAGTLIRAVQRAGLGDQGPDLAAALAGMAAGGTEPEPGEGDGDSTVVRLPARRAAAGRDGGRAPRAGSKPGSARAASAKAGAQPGRAKKPGAKVTELAAAREKAARERQQQAIAEADRELAAADRAVRKTSRVERDEEAAVQELEAEVEDARQRLADARQRLSDARAAAQRALTGQRRAQKALDKARG
jgi:hypothetical protein